MDTAISVLKHIERDIRGDSPDKSENRQGGWAHAWEILARKAGKPGEPFPEAVITHITKFVNDNHLTIVGAHYISPTGVVSNSETPLPGNAILVDTQIINGVTVNILGDPQAEEKNEN